MNDLRTVEVFLFGAFTGAILMLLVLAGGFLATF
jgi:hypothetical protein